MIDIFLYSILGLIILFFELSRKRYFLIDHISFFNFFFFLVYCFTPISLLVNGDHLINYDMPYGSEYFGHNQFTSSIILGAYLLFISGYILTINTKQNYYFKYQTVFNTSMIVKVLPILFGILSIFLFVYINEFGSFQAAISQSEAYRSAEIAYHRFGFMARLFPLNTILLYYLFFKVILERKDNYRSILIFYFIISIIFTLILISLNSSRGYMIFHALGLYVMYAIYHKNYFLRYMIPALILAILIMKFGRPLLNSVSDLVTYGFDTFWNNFLLRLEAMQEADESIISNFTHPIVSLEASLARSGVDIELRYFKDIFYAFYALLPNELLGIKDPKMLMHVNTEILQGNAVEDVLPGILGFFSYQLNAIGVLLGSFIYGISGGYLYKIFINFYTQTKSSIIYIYLISLTYGYFVFRGSPSNIVIEKFVLMCILIVIFFYSKFIIISLNSQTKNKERTI